jgi:hypothetical protein
MIDLAGDESRCRVLELLRLIGLCRARIGLAAQAMETLE